MTAALPEPEHGEQTFVRRQPSAVEVWILFNAVVGVFLGLSFSGLFELLGLTPLIDRDQIPFFLIVLVIFDASWLVGFALLRWLGLTIAPLLPVSAFALIATAALFIGMLPPYYRLKQISLDLPSRQTVHPDGDTITPISQPSPQPTPTPTPQTTTAAGSNPTAYWNTWFEYQGETAPEVLTVGNTYSFALDISPFEYAKLRSSVARSSNVDPGIREILADPKNNRIAFRIKPLLAEGGGLKFVVPDQPDVPLNANLPAIRNPNSAEAARYVAGTISLAEFSDRAAAGNVRFAVSTEAPGCAAVVLAVFSEDGRFPLDHLVRWVPIVKPGESPPTCASEISGEHVQQYGGLDTLLQVSLELNEAGTSKVADAAFHIFDTPAGSFVIFSDGRPAQKKAIYAWQTGDSLVRYVADEHRLPLLIKGARDAVANGKPDSYVNAAQELAAVLFGGNSPRDENEAGLAKAAFQDIVAQSAKRPVVVVRVVSDSRLGQNRSVFLPLGILAASGNGAILAKPITVIQPLPREHYGSQATCVGDWTFGVPPKLDQDPEDLSKLWPPDASGKNWFHDLAGLKAYLSDPTPTGNQPGQGFLLLAHHGSGNLWFDNEAQRVIRQNITRNFPSGSVGVFAACSVATATYDASFVQRFNEHGVDTLIASPFPVPIAYGTRLALEFPQAIEDARRDSAKPTVSDLFAAAIKRTADRLAVEFKKNYGEMGLEYVLLGSPNTPLCAKVATGANP